jgi:hypothetical protein
VLVPDPEYAPVVQEMARRYVDGDSFHMISLWLNDQGVPLPRDVQRLRRVQAKALETGKKPPADSEVIRGRGWTTQSVRQALSSPTLGGFVPSRGELRRDAKNIVVRSKPLISAEEYGRLEAALKARANARRSDASSLLGVARCLLCTAPYHITTYKGRSSGKYFRYYQCDNARQVQCPAGRIPEQQLVDLVTGRFLDVVGGQPVLEPVYIAAVNYSQELADIEDAIKNLQSQVGRSPAYKGEEGIREFLSLIGSLQEDKARLLALDTSPARTEYHETGKTFRQRWEENDEEGRRRLMADSGFRFFYARIARSPAEIQADARRLGIARTARQLWRRASNLKYNMTEVSKPARLAELQAELVTVEAERQQLRDIPKYREAYAAPIGEELARRAGLVASGQLVILPDDAAAWEKVLAPARAALLSPRPVA